MVVCIYFYKHTLSNYPVIDRPEKTWNWKLETFEKYIYFGLFVAFINSSVIRGQEMLVKSGGNSIDKLLDPDVNPRLPCGLHSSVCC